MGKSTTPPFRPASPGAGGVSLDGRYMVAVPVRSPLRALDLAAQNGDRGLREYEDSLCRAVHC